LTVARLLDAAAVALALAFASTLVHWWARPEIVFLVLLGVVSARFLIAPLPVPAVRPRAVVGMGVTAYALALSFVTVTRHVTLMTHALDLGYYVQLTWNLARGHGPRVSLPEMHAWGDHLSPIMYAFAPLFWIGASPVTLLIAQSVALAMGAVAVFGIARRRLGDERPAAAFALLYLVNPSLHGINIRDFHAAALAIPLVLAAVWAVEAGRPVVFVAAVALTLACREDAALPVLGLGAWLAFGRRRWLLGLATGAAALAVLLVDLTWVIPAYRGAPYPHLARYAGLGTSVTGILGGALLHPARSVALVATGGRFVYVLALLAPFGFLPLLSPLDCLGALPALGQNLLGSDPILYNYRTQYQSFVLPFLVVAAIGGYARVARAPGRRPATLLVVAAIASLTLTARTVNSFAFDRWWPRPEQRAAYAVLAEVPPDAAVSAQDPYVPHLSLRPLVFVFPVGIEKSQFVLVNLASYPWRALPDVRMRRDGDRVTITVPGAPEYSYTVTARAGPHLLLRRQTDASAGPSARLPGSSR
jgi:uncharacterized membrane protein